MTENHGNAFMPIKFQHVGSGNLQVHWNDKVTFLKNMNQDKLRKIILKMKPNLGKQSYSAFAKDVFTKSNKEMPSFNLRFRNSGSIEEILTESVKLYTESYSSREIQDYLKNMQRISGLTKGKIESLWDSAVEITQEMFGIQFRDFTAKEIDYAKTTLANSMGFRENTIEGVENAINLFEGLDVEFKDFINNSELYKASESETEEDNKQPNLESDGTQVSTDFSIGEPHGLNHKKKKTKVVEV